MKPEYEIQFAPIYELANSLHTYICKKSGNKIDLGKEWAARTTDSLSADLRDKLEKTELDNDWKLLQLLLYLCPAKESVQSALDWLERQTVGMLYELLSLHIRVFPASMEHFRDRYLGLLSEWERQYFREVDPAVLKALQEQKERGGTEQAAAGDEGAEAWVDGLTGGFRFLPVDGLERVVLIPQYHFQPAGIIYHYGTLTLCHYAARLSLTEEDISPFLYRPLRSLAEKSRLKILHSLREGRKSFTQVARESGLSKGIVHDHLFNLRNAGLLHIDIEGENVAGYSLRIEGVYQLHSRLLEYLE